MVAIEIALILLMVLSGTALAYSPATFSSRVVVAPSNWLTYHKDLARDGYDNTTGGRWPPSLAWRSSTLDGAIYAEPLFYNGLVIVATENDSVYALNATQGGKIAWRAHLGTPVPGDVLPCGDINPSGITGTPAIDPSTGVLYVVAYIYRGTTENPVHTLFGLQTNTGQILFKRHVNPAGVSPLVEQERGALAIVNGVVYIPYGGLAGDCGDYHGYVVGVPENLSSNFQYKVPTGREGGIWAPSGPSVDSQGDVFVATGNSASTTKFDYGESVIRLSPTLKELDYFAPKNWRTLDSGDLDVGSVGPAILGKSGIIFQIGKEGVGYLLNMSHLGGIGGQVFSKQICPTGYGAFGGIAYVANVTYVPCTSGIVAVKVKFFPKPVLSILWTGPAFHAGPPIFSNKVIWTVDINGGELYALDPSNGTVLYSHSVGNVEHFTSPTAAEDMIFVAGSQTVYAFYA
jgi:outer membrane protein assembly factor BamB